MKRKKIETDEEFEAVLDEIGNSGMSDIDKISTLTDMMEITDEELEEARQAIVKACEEEGTFESLKMARNLKYAKQYQESFR